MTRDDILTIDDLQTLMDAAVRVRDRAFGAIQTWSPKVFLPLTHLCRDRWREVRLMHAVARLALHPHIRSVQTSWVKLGPMGAAACLEGGANDLGGTLMNESISRAAGADHGEEFPPQQIEALISSLGRVPRQRTTLHSDVPAHVLAAGRNAAILAPIVQTPLTKSREKMTTYVE
jgi:FO synthase